MVNSQPPLFKTAYLWLVALLLAGINLALVFVWRNSNEQVQAAFNLLQKSPSKELLQHDQDHNELVIVRSAYDSFEALGKSKVTLNKLLAKVLKLSEPKASNHFFEGMIYVPRMLSDSLYQTALHHRQNLEHLVSATFVPERTSNATYYNKLDWLVREWKKKKSRKLQTSADSLMHFDISLDDSTRISNALWWYRDNADMGLVKKIEGSLAKLNAMMPGHGEFLIYGRRYSLDHVTAAELHMICKQLMLLQNQADGQALTLRNPSW